MRTPMLSGPRITLGKKGGKHVKDWKSLAPSAADLRKLEDELYWAQQRAIDLSQLNMERAAADAASLLAFQSETMSTEYQADLTTKVFKLAPWVLGGVALLVGAGIFVGRKKKRRKTR